MLFKNEHVDDNVNMTLDSVDRDGNSDSNDSSACDIDDYDFFYQTLLKMMSITNLTLTS